MITLACRLYITRDEQVREVALATAQAWLESFVLPARGAADVAAVQRLTQTPFAASVEWTLTQ